MVVPTSFVYGRGAVDETTKAGGFDQTHRNTSEVMLKPVERLCARVPTRPWKLDAPLCAQTSHLLAAAPNNPNFPGAACLHIPHLGLNLVLWQGRLHLLYFTPTLHIQSPPLLSLALAGGNHV